MDSSTALAFCYPKAAGLLTKAFIKDKAHLLFECESLAALWDTLFKEPVPVVPETLLARSNEEKALDNFLYDYVFFLNQYDKPPLVLLDNIKRYEIENLKEIVDALCAGKKEIPPLLDLSSTLTPVVSIKSADVAAFNVCSVTYFLSRYTVWFLSAVYTQLSF